MENILTENQEREFRKWFNEKLSKGSGRTIRMEEIQRANRGKITKAWEVHFLDFLSANAI